MSSHKILKVASANTTLQQDLSKSLKISKILAQLLINRGITQAQEAEKFLKADLANLLDPYLFQDMPKAVKLIEQAISKKDAVMLYGDYDVDGVTALAILKNTLKKKGLDTQHHIPHRIKDGYGLNKNILPILKQKKIKLLITVDCGTSSLAEIKAMREAGIEVIVTDHHQPSDAALPAASAILNPKLKHCTYLYKELAGVGVAYKLCQALSKNNLKDDLDLVSLGTIADVVPLTGENRIIAKEGLLSITRRKRPGINALIEVSRLGKREINAQFVSFILGPRINASGRMDTAETALKLLLSTEQKEAEEFARALDTHNRQRQKVENGIMEEAQAMIAREVNFKEHKVIVLAKEGWHQGVLGIVASKIADKFYRPTIVISMGEKFCKGSGRSIKNFHLFSALLECKELLEAFGGHSHAVGLTVDKKNIEHLKRKINQLAKDQLALEDLLPSLEIDLELDFADLNERLVEEIALLEPFGTCNPEPLFYTRNLKLKGEPLLLSRDTLKFWGTDGKITCSIIGFGMGSFRESLMQANSFDLVYTPQIDTWQEKSSLILEAKEIFLK